MNTVQENAIHSVDELLQAVAQLQPDEEEQFFTQVLAWRANRRMPGLSPQETALLRQINRGLPAHVQQRFDELNAQRRAATLTPEEHTELVQIINRVEKYDARRVEWLGQLAILHGQSLRQIMQEVGLSIHSYDL